MTTPRNISARLAALESASPVAGSAPIPPEILAVIEDVEAAGLLPDYAAYPATPDGTFEFLVEVLDRAVTLKRAGKP